MTSKPERVLPDTLHSALTQLGAALNAGHVPEALLDVVLTELEKLQPKDASSAAQAISTCANISHRYHYDYPFSRNLKQSQQALFLLSHEPKLGLLFLFHGDGYVREAALNAIDRPARSAFFLAALAWRLNDWVRPVRIAARRCFERVEALTPAAVIVETSPFLLDRWRHWARSEPDNAALLDHMFQRPDVTAGLASWFETGCSGPLATQLSYALRWPQLDAHLLRLARHALNPSVRVAALRTLLAERASWPTGFGEEWIDKRYGRSRRFVVYDHRPLTVRCPKDRLIRMGLADRSAPVRRIAADAVTQNPALFPDLEKIVAGLRADKSPAVRERGEFMGRMGAQGGG